MQLVTGGNCAEVEVEDEQGQSNLDQSPGPSSAPATDVGLEMEESSLRPFGSTLQQSPFSLGQYGSNSTLVVAVGLAW